MSRFVLIWFKEDEDAENYVNSSVFAKGHRVVGMYQDARHKPCSCDNMTWINNRMWGISKKYGWPVHHVCGRVSKTFRESYGRRMFQVFGTNLLDIKETPKIFQDWKQSMRQPRN
jgi:hypothetical protein